MDCTITSITRKRHKVGCAGFTLVELLIAIGISGIIFVALGMMIFFSGRSYAALANYVDLDSRSRQALDLMSKDIRQVNGVTGSGTTNLPSGQVVTNILVLSGSETDGKHKYVGHHLAAGQVRSARTGNTIHLANVLRHQVQGLAAPAVQIDIVGQRGIAPSAEKNHHPQSDKNYPAD